MTSHRELAGFRTMDAWIDGLATCERNRDGESLAYLKLRECGAAAIPALLNGLRDVNGRVRACSASVLAELGPDAACAVGPLMTALEDPKARVRRAAIGALRRMGVAANAAVHALVERLVRDRDRDVRILAAQALEVVGSPEPAL